MIYRLQCICSRSNKLPNLVYVDGIEFNIKLDLETGNITVLGNTGISMGELIFEPDSGAMVNIENKGIVDEHYTLEYLYKQ